MRGLADDLSTSILLIHPTDDCALRVLPRTLIPGSRYDIPWHQDQYQNQYQGPRATYGGIGLVAAAAGLVACRGVRALGSTGTSGDKSTQSRTQSHTQQTEIAQYIDDRTYLVTTILL